MEGNMTRGAQAPSGKLPDAPEVKEVCPSTSSGPYFHKDIIGTHTAFGFVHPPRHHMLLILGCNPDGSVWCYPVSQITTITGPFLLLRRLHCGEVTQQRLGWLSDGVLTECLLSTSVGLD